MPHDLFCKLVAVDPLDPSKGANFDSVTAIDEQSLAAQIEEDKKYGKLNPHNGQLWVQLLQHDTELTRGQFRKGAWSSMLAWERVIDVDFVRVKLDSPPDIKIMFKSSTEDPLFKNEPNVLAYMYYPIASPSFRGICVINADYPWTYDGSDRSGQWILDKTGKRVQNLNSMYQTWSLFKVIRHELGHGIGLPHSKLQEQTMSSSYGKMADRNTDRDNKRGQAKYGISSRSHRWKNVMNTILNRLIG